jgi:hypothetical protein
MGYRLPAGHRWRVGVSPTYWRRAWPSPEPVRLSLFTGAGCRLRLPVRDHYPADDRLPPFEPPEQAAPLALEKLRTPFKRRTVKREPITGKTEYQIFDDDGRVRITDTGMEIEDVGVETYTIYEGNPLSAAVHIQKTIEYQRDDWQVRVETDSKMTADATRFHVTNVLAGFEGKSRVFSKTWDFSVPRDHV